MRPDAACKDRIAIVQQVLGRDGRRHPRPCARDEFSRARRRDVLEHHLEPRKSLDERGEHLVDEDRLAVEDIDIRARRFAVHQERHAELFHAPEHRIGLADVRDARVRMRGRARRVELDAVHRPGLRRSIDLLGGGAVRQVQRHQRREAAARRQCGQNALAIGECQRDRGDRRLEIRHHDGAAEARGGEFRHGGERCAVAQVHVPVVGPLNRQAGSLACGRGAAIPGAADRAYSERRSR